MGIQLAVPGLNRDAVRDRINELLNKKTRAEQALIKEKTGLDNKKIINVLGANKANISMEFMAIFAQALNVPLEYILYGKEIPLDLKRIEYYDIPYIENAPTEDGNIVFSDKNRICAMRIDFIKSITDHPRNIVIYQVDSDVMEDTILKGDELLIDLSKKFIKDGLIYAFNSFNFKCIRVRRFSVQVNHIKLIADNKMKYEPCIADLKDINIIGQIIASKHFL